MCGIIGYVGNQDATPILIDGLKKLEYRGYDSSGVGVIEQSQTHIEIRKNQGKIVNLQQLISSQPLAKANVGISHTRWATHGAPNKVNSHPHADCSGKILVVHNGIIENYEQIKTKLLKNKHKFLSDTDTEVIVHLIEEYYKGDIVKAVQKAIAELEGAFALGVICVDQPDMLVAARVGSPLIVGIGKGENFIASDAPAILDQTRKVIYLKDGEMAVLTKDKVDVLTFAGKKVKVKIDKITYSIDAVQKQGYAHFMMKEMHEQADVFDQMLRQRLKGNKVVLNGIGLSDIKLKQIKNITIVACGTAFHAGLVGRYLIESFAGIPVNVDVSSEFRYRDPILDKNSLVLAVSQSGETADTLAAVREAKNKGAKIISICNVIGSSLARESDGILYTHAGPEIGVASTKAYTAQLMMFYFLALKLGALTKYSSKKKQSEMLAALREAPALYRKMFKKKNKIAEVARANSHFGCFLFLGRNINFPTAMEGALKLKEISYIPAEGYAAGEMKHGPIALIDEYRAVICVAPASDIYEKMVSNIQEIRSRKGKVIVIATEGDKNIKKLVTHCVYIPEAIHELTPLLAVLPLQLIAYYIAVQRGCDVDQPRNLAKSVTVE